MSGDESGRGGFAMNPFDAFDGSLREVSNGKPQEGDGHLTHLTDLTVNERGCTWRPSAGARRALAPLTYLPVNCRQIRQMCQVPRAVMRFRFDPRRQTGCQFDAPLLGGGR
jgi:hypothetical protein